MFEEENRILQLQRKFESGLIKEEEISESDKEKLIELYKTQIKTIKGNINMYNAQTEEYKRKIIEIRKKMKKD